MRYPHYDLDIFPTKAGNIDEDIKDVTKIVSNASDLSASTEIEDLFYYLVNFNKKGFPNNLKQNDWEKKFSDALP